MEVNQKLIERHLQKIVGERTYGLSDSHLEEVMQYMSEHFQGLGYETKLHSFEFQNKNFNNIIARKKGKTSDDRIIVAAHFDSVPNSPGADDNASGVVAMLELARMLSRYEWNHTVEFIGFHLEEWNMIGSSAYVKKLKEKKTNVRGMISLEMIGYTSNEPKSQKLPPGFAAFYPNVGNFIGIVSNIRSRDMLWQFEKQMKTVEGLPVEGLLLPFNGLPLPAVRLSDHSPFWDAGYPALLITDTSFFRNPHYHTESDTIETLDLDFMTKVTEGVSRALLALDVQQ